MKGCCVVLNRGGKSKKRCVKLILFLLITLLFLCANSLVVALEGIEYNRLELTLEFDEVNGTLFVPEALYIGEADGANDGPPPDSYDIPTPPPPPDSYVSVWLDDGLPSPYEKLYRDYRSYPDTYKTWNLSILWIPTVNSPPTIITILWDPNQIINCEYDFFDLWNMTQIVADMKVDRSYSFTAENYVVYKFFIIARIVEEPDDPEDPGDDDDDSNNGADNGRKTRRRTRKNKGRDNNSGINSEKIFSKIINCKINKCIK
jgi:hypothetical protein